MSSSSWATLRLVARAASSSPALVAGETRHVYTSVFRAMHYSVVQFTQADAMAAARVNRHALSEHRRGGSHYSTVAESIRCGGCADRPSAPA